MFGFGIVRKKKMRILTEQIHKMPEVIADGIRQAYAEGHHDGSEYSDENISIEVKKERYMRDLKMSETLKYMDRLGKLE